MTYRNAGIQTLLDLCQFEKKSFAEFRDVIGTVKSFFDKGRSRRGLVQDRCTELRGRKCSDIKARQMSNEEVWVSAGTACSKPGVSPLTTQR